MPLAGRLLSTRYVPGRLFGVNPRCVRAVPRLFTRNERLVSVFETEAGPMAVIMVGAFIVGGIHDVATGRVCPPHRRVPLTTDFNDEAPAYARGDEMGHFCLGSSAILVFGRDAVDFAPDLASGQAVRLNQSPGQRHMHTVIIVWCKVQRGVAPPDKARCQIGIGQQFRQIISQTLGLENPPVFDIAKRPEPAVDGAGQRITRCRHGALPGSQRAREKRIERGIGGRVGLSSLVHINGRIPFQKCVDERALEPRGRVISQPERAVRDHPGRQTGQQTREKTIAEAGVWSSGHEAGYGLAQTQCRRSGRAEGIGPRPRKRSIWFILRR